MAVNLFKRAAPGPFGQRPGGSEDASGEGLAAQAKELYDIPLRDPHVADADMIEQSLVCKTGVCDGGQMCTAPYVGPIGNEHDATLAE
jgi:hypothetical protein